MNPIEPSVTQEAEDLVAGQRRQEYGPAWINFDRIAKLWSAYLGREVTMADVCWMMTLLKAARHADGGEKIKRDNIVDSIGYLRLIEIIKTETQGGRLEDGDKI